tara:strand:- start:527 stop:1411 length:885 start_codon:yes stop_codon:yes gene_type:complete
MINKISIGTASFGMKYGVINREKETLDKNTISKILSICKEAGIKKIDTAFDYGNAHNILSQCLPSNHCFEITTKVSFKTLDDNNKEELNKLEKEIKTLLKDWGVEYIDALLLHKYKDIKRERIKEWLEKLRSKGLVKYVGISSYFDEINQDILKQNLNKLQIPISCVDQRILNKLREEESYKNIFNIISARSVYLQGILLCDIEKLPKFINNSDYMEIKRWHYQLAQAGISPQSYCMNYILSQEEVDEIIIGLNSTAEAEALINNSEIHKKEKQVSISPPKLSNGLIDPRGWPI